MRKKIRKALEDPSKIKPHLWGRTIGRIQNIPYRLFFDRQYKRLHNDLFEEDKFLLIILDACRHDYFEEEYGKFFEGEYEKVYSSGKNTFQYVRNTYPGEYKNMLYVSGATPINSYVDNSEESHMLYESYTPSEHLRIVDAHNEAWDDKLHAVDPGEVTEMALDRINIEDKLTVHYFQPHSPYVGELSPLDEEERNAADHPADWIVWEKFKKGEITEKEMRKAYRSNLRKALEEARKLVEETDEDTRVIITSDHGENFGKHGMYGHAHQHPGLRLVPWLEVKETN
jgi:arylsulfatase A-like enzyme